MKQTRKKRIWSAAASALLCLPFALGVLGGCGGDNGTGGGNSGNNEGGGGGNEGGSGTTLPTAQTTVEDSGKLTYSGLAAVNDTDPYAVNALDKEVTYLLSLDADRLLYNFFENAGQSNPSGVRRYDGTGSWENSLIAGHTMGHYLSALSQAYASGGTSAEQKAEIGERINYIVNSLKSCQDETYAEHNTGAKEGFLWGANVSGHNSNVEFQFNNVEQGKTNIGSEAWVPWYTMHKILAGFIDLYNNAGNETALAVAKNLGDWVYDRVTKWSEETRKTVLSTEYGGMNDCLYNLYAVTGDERYAVAAHQFDEDIPTQGTFAQTSMVDLMYDNDTANYLLGQHANTTIPKVIGLLNGYIRTQGKTIDGVTAGTNRTPVTWYLQAAENFWDRVVNHMSYVTGGNSEDEHFRSDDSQNRYRDYDNCETCNTYNMLKLSRMLFTITKDKKYLDYYENTYINAILSSQNPETGMTMYFQPMASGYYKTYSSPESSFWCCTGSGMESMSKLGDSIYYTAGNATYVAMYMSSTYKTDEVSLTMTADLENSDVVTVKVDAGKTILRLRRPDWTTKFEVKVGESSISVPADDDFADIEVSTGMTVTVTLGKQITMHNLPDAENVYAFKYGPYVLSAELGTENMKSGTHGWAGSIEVPNKLTGLQESYNVTNRSLADFKANINTYMTRGTDGKFTLTGIDDGPLTYSIHYKQHTQRYSLYFRFIGTDAAPEQDSGYEDVTVDSIQPGRGQYETADRMVDAENSVGADSESSRYASAGGSFSYYMGVNKAKSAANYIMTNFMKADNGKTVKISVGGTVLYTATLNYTGADAMYEVYIHIPQNIVEAAQKRTIDTNEKDCILIKIESNTAEASARVVSAFNIITRELKKGGIAYFVNCGDNDVHTLSEGDTYGLYNSVTDKAYGVDAGTDMSWGAVDEYEWTWSAQATYSGAYDKNAQPNGGVSTKSTWAQEGIADGVDKTVSNRYTKNHYECGLSPKLTYKFDLPNGNYTVKMYFVDPWSGVSINPSVNANGTQQTNCATGEEISLTATVSDGTLTLNFTTQSLCINLAYIIIALA